MTRHAIALIILFALPFRETLITLGPVTYRIAHDSSRETDPGLFHEIFLGELEYLSGRFVTKTRDDIQVVLCGGGWIFRQMTGLDAKTAGLYNSSRDTFYFQDPAILLRKDILTATIRHECMHYIINCARIKKYDPGGCWIEESLCLALFPVASYPDMAGNGDTDTLIKLKYYLNHNLDSSDPAKKKRAYALAARWGKILVQNAGERKIFKVLTEGDVTVDWDRMFALFIKNRHSIAP